MFFYVWTVFYFNNKYEGDNVYSGWGDKEDKENYHKTPKKVYVIEQAVIGVTLVALYIYFIIVCSTWESLADN